MSALQNKNKGFFITGTDTGIGKTVVGASLLMALAELNFKTIGIKPIASGCTLTTNGLRNDDALLLQKHATKFIAYDQINPFAFKEPIAPHLAAKQVNINLTVNDILARTKTAMAQPVDYVIIEGAGGLYVPLNSQETMIDLINAYSYPVILVVGIKLGCINHALLTQTCLKHANINIAGWIANTLYPYDLYEDANIKAIKERIEAPLLGTIPYQKNLIFKHTLRFFNENFSSLFARKFRLC